MADLQKDLQRRRRDPAILDIRRALGHRIWPLIVALAACGAKPPSCDQLVAAQDWSKATAVCTDAYRQTKDARAGVAAARSQLRLGQADAAQALARELATGERAADAQLLLGELALRRRDLAAAQAAYDAAERGFERRGDSPGVSRAAHGLAGIWLARRELGQAMAASQRALEHAQRAGDRVMLFYARLGRADLLRQQGALDDAEAELARVADLARTPRDRAWIALKLGVLYVDRELDGLARSQLAQVLADPVIASAPELALAARLNLTWIARRAGDFKLALQHLDAAAALDADDADVRVNRALVLADQGQLAQATAELARAAAGDDGEDGSRAWWIAYQQAAIAERRGDAVERVAALQRAIAAVGAMSAHAGAFAPDIAASHREAFLELLGIHARQGEWLAAIALVMQLDALSLLATERRPAQRPDDAPPAEPAPSRPALPSPERVVQAWRGRRLLIVVPDGKRMWRIDVRDGVAAGRDVGDAAALEAAAHTLAADPRNAPAAALLGAAIVPADAGLADVLLIGGIARTPLAALTRNGQPLEAPLARVLGVLPRAPHHAQRTGYAVLGDPRGDLPSARAEASAVAQRLGLAPVLGDAATSHALAAASTAELLHIASHSTLELTGARLVLADRSISRDDILAPGHAPRVVVLASCGGAAARDDAGWGSLAAAFLAAGADTVIAASWSIEDADTARFVAELYRHGVIEQPARALAAAQAATRETLPPRIWAGFTAISAPPAL